MNTCEKNRFRNTKKTKKKHEKYSGEGNILSYQITCVCVWIATLILLGLSQPYQ